MARWALRVALGTLLVTGAACGSTAGVGDGHAHPPVGIAAGGGRSMEWILTRRALSQLSADATVRARLLAGRVYEIVTPAQTADRADRIVPTVNFSSFAEMAAAVEAGHLPPGTGAVLYDAESWSFTPVNEQRDPRRYYAEAGELAAAHGLTLIAAPALNLAGGGAPSSNTARAAAYLRGDLPAIAAGHAAVYEIQAQSLERDPARYAAFVRSAAAAARRANPAVSVLAGLSTNPPGSAVTAGQLEAAIAATRGVVDGYWINVPGAGPKCPTCNPEDPAVAIDALRRTAL